MIILLGNLSISRSTYAGNLQWIKRRYDTACYDFENIQDEGILGKGISRPFHRIYHVSVLMLATIIVLIGQPLLSLCTIIVTYILVLTSFLWAASTGVISLFPMLCTELIYHYRYILVGGVGGWTNLIQNSSDHFL